MRRLEGQRVLVTGAAGFIGANLVRTLVDRGVEVHAAIRPTSNPWRLEGTLAQLKGIHRVDLVNRSDTHRVVQAARPTVIFHGAAPSGHPTGVAPSASFFVETLLGTVHLLEAASDGGVGRFVHLGSLLEYGPRRRALREQDRLDPVTTRGAAKAATTLLCRQWARSSGLPLVVLRLFSVYGYWEGGGRLIPRAILAGLRGESLPLTVPGFRRDLVFVEDVVDACERAAEAPLPPGEIVNIGTGRQSTNEAVIRVLQTVSGLKIRVRPGDYPTRAVDATHSMASISRARRLLGWRPRHDLRRGLAKTVDWFRTHHERYPVPGG